MLDLIRGRGRAGRVLAVAITSVSVLALSLVATPAHAADPTDAENFNPDQPPADATASTEFMVMSDRNDGTNSTFHVNTVASTDTSLVQWYYCPTGYTGSDPTLSGSGCTLAGSDSSAETVTPTAPASEAEVYEMDFNVPDDALHDWVAWYCTQTPATDANCAQEKEDDVQFDDAQTGTPESQSPAGEITFPPNPASVSETGFTATATTDPTVTEVLFCYENDADEDEDPADCDYFDVDNTPNNTPSQQTSFKTWSAFIDPGDDGDGALILFESAGGATNSLPSGAQNCTGDGNVCQLDSHYVGAGNPTPTSIALSWEDFDEAPDPPNGECDQDFAAAGGPVRDIDTGPGGTPDLSGCIFDQSGNLITNDLDWAMQISPKDPDASAANDRGLDGDDTSDDDGDENDTDGDFFFEQVAGDPGSAAENGDADKVDQAVNLVTLGTYTVTFCRDSDDNADDGAGQSATPCAGESLSTTATIEIMPLADHVHVKRSGTEGALCHTGSSTTTAPAGSTVNLVGCALNTSATTEQPAPGTHVIWIINPAGNPDDPGVVSGQETLTNSAGKANAQVTSGGGAADKTTTVRFCRDEFPFGGDGNGICDSGELGDPALQADFQINWTERQITPTPDDDDRRCKKAKKRVRRIRRQLRFELRGPDKNDEKIKRLRKRLRRAKARRARLCRR